MKTRYKITMIVTVVIFSILFVPPNVAAFSCNTLKNKDLNCHVVGMTFFGIAFPTSIYHWFEWNDPLPCGGIMAHPDKMYPCIGIADYWGYPQKLSPFAERVDFESEPEPEPQPSPEEYPDVPVSEIDQYVSPFDEELIQEFQKYHTVITGKVKEWYGQKQPSKYYYQYRVEALAHHTPRMQDGSVYIIMGNEDNFIPVNADVVLFGLDMDKDGSLYIVNAVIQEKRER